MFVGKPFQLPRKCIRVTRIKMIVLVNLPTLTVMVSNISSTICLEIVVENIKSLGFKVLFCNTKLYSSFVKIMFVCLHNKHNTKITHTTLIFMHKFSL